MLVNPWTLPVVVAASVLASLDLFVMNLAFPSIRNAFPGTTDQGLSWLLNGYGILFAAMLIPSGRLADRYGRRRLFRIGLAVFALGSMVAPAAPNLAALVAGRCVQGIGAALLVPTSLGLLMAAYPKDRHQRMLSIWSATGSIAAALGPTLGGLLVDIDWRLIFVINIPIALVALALGRNLAESPRSGTRVPDVLGSALLATSVGLLTAAVCYGPTWGLGSIALWAVGAGAVICFGLFVHRCVHVATPAVDLRVFRVRSLSAATVAMAGFYIGFAIMLLGGSLYLTQVWHWRPVLAGLGLGVGPATAVVAALAIGRMNVGPRTLAVLGGLLFVAAGIWWIVMLSGTTNYPLDYLPGMILTGTGAGVAQTAFLTAGTAHIPAAQYATASGVLNTARQIGGAVGIALLVALTGTAVDATQYRSAWLAMVATGLLAALIALSPAFTRGTVPREADVPATPDLAQELGD